jgi:hypothetical protein
MELFAKSILESEAGIAAAPDAERSKAFTALIDFLMSFASRTGTAFTCSTVSWVALPLSFGRLGLIWTSTTIRQGSAASRAILKASRGSRSCTGRWIGLPRIATFAAWDFLSGLKT